MPSSVLVRVTASAPAAAAAIPTSKFAPKITLKLSVASDCVGFDNPDAQTTRAMIPANAVSSTALPIVRDAAEILFSSALYVICGPLRAPAILSMALMNASFHA